jgi:hypothetical protein
VLEAYGADAALRRRERRYWQLHELHGIAIAVELADDAMLADGIAKLRCGAMIASRLLG